MTYFSSEFTTTIHRFDEIERRLTNAESRANLFLCESFQTLLRAKLDSLLVDNAGVLSLDVFDTLLLRDNSSELTRFFEIGGQMAAIANEAGEIGSVETRRTRPTSISNKRAISQVDAFLARLLGTKASYKASAPVRGCREGSLSEIHRTASRVLMGTDFFTDAFVDAELAYEAARIRPNAFLLDYIERHLQRGGRAVLITDMYMHADHVGRLLKAFAIDPAQYEILLSSADTKVSKATGGVFGQVERMLKTTGVNIVHVGDSLRGDFVCPIRRGWKALHLPLAEADIVMRRRDHLETANLLADTFDIEVDIAMPH